MYRYSYAYVQLIHSVVEQKLTQHCKATIHKKTLKTKTKNKENAAASAVSSSLKKWAGGILKQS